MKVKAVMIHTISKSSRTRVSVSGGMVTVVFILIDLIQRYRLDPLPLFLRSKSSPSTKQGNVLSSLNKMYDRWASTASESQACALQ